MLPLHDCKQKIKTTVGGLTDAPMSVLEGQLPPLNGSFLGLTGSEEFSGKLLPVISLTSQGKSKANGKFHQFLVDTRATL